MVVSAQMWGFIPAWVVFLLAAVIIFAAGARMSALADELADRTGLGEAMMGAIFLGALTSLPGITASITAAAGGQAELAMSNAMGGIAAQTAFLAVADLFHREANLEHAAASPENLAMGATLLILLGILLVAFSGPNWTLGHVDVLSILLLGTYAYLMVIVFRVKSGPMWHPRMTRETRKDVPGQGSGRSTGRLWGELAICAFLVIASGWAITHAAEGIATATGLSYSVVGATLLAIATSLPELVTTVAAVRRGALTLAVGGIMGGNAFDTLVAAMADTAYLKGSIYAVASDRVASLTAVTVIMTSLVLMGLLRREKSGPLGIGFESLAVLVVYVGGMITITSAS